MKIEWIATGNADTLALYIDGIYSGYMARSSQPGDKWWIATSRSIGGVLLIDGRLAAQAALLDRTGVNSNED